MKADLYSIGGGIREGYVSLDRDHGKNEASSSHLGSLDSELGRKTAAGPPASPPV